MTIRALRLVIIAIAVSLSFYLATTAAQPQSNPPAEKPAEQVYKNIQVFKGVPASRLMAGMTRLSQFLGVDCAYCHVPNEFEKDDKPVKQTARKMFELVRTINTMLNTNSVTCYTCHRGKPKPESLPPANPSGADQSLTKPEIKPSASMPSVDRILAAYLRALGGQAALARVTTRLMKGALVTQGGDRAPLEVWEKAPHKSFTTFRLPMGAPLTVFNGVTGWRQEPGRNLQEISGAELTWMKFEAEFHKELKVRERYPQMKALGTARLGERETYVIEATAAAREPETWYFDAESGLLLRVDLVIVSPQGKGAVQVFYEDYRAVDGVKMPFAIRRVRPGFTWTYKFDEIKLNTSIDDAKFDKPANPQ